MNRQKQFYFKVEQKLDDALARTGIITTPHGLVKTPAFIPVDTAATLKGLTPEQFERFIIKLVDGIRDSIEQGNFYGFRDNWLARYYA